MRVTYIEHRHYEIKRLLALVSLWLVLALSNSLGESPTLIDTLIKVDLPAIPAIESCEIEVYPVDTRVAPATQGGCNQTFSLALNQTYDVRAVISEHSHLRETWLNGVKINNSSKLLKLKLPVARASLLVLDSAIRLSRYHSTINRIVVLSPQLDTQPAAEPLLQSLKETFAKTPVELLIFPYSANLSNTTTLTNKIRSKLTAKHGNLIILLAAPTTNLEKACNLFRELEPFGDQLWWMNPQTEINDTCNQSFTKIAFNAANTPFIVQHILERTSYFNGLVELYTPDRTTQPAATGLLGQRISVPIGDYLLKIYAHNQLFKIDKVMLTESIRAHLTELITTNHKKEQAREA